MPQKERERWSGGGKPHPMHAAPFYHKLMWTWLMPLITAGSRQQLEVRLAGQPAAGGESGRPALAAPLIQPGRRTVERRTTEKAVNRGDRRRRQVAASARVAAAARLQA